MICSRALSIIGIAPEAIESPDNDVMYENFSVISPPPAATAIHDSCTIRQNTTSEYIPIAVLVVDTELMEAKVVKVIIYNYSVFNHNDHFW